MKKNIYLLFVACISVFFMNTRVFSQDSAWVFVDEITNELPVVKHDTIAIMVGNALVVNVFDHAYDPESDDFVIDHVFDPRNGEAYKLTDSTFSVTITCNYEGFDSLLIKLEEFPGSMRSEGYLILDVAKNPEFPTALNDTVDAFQGDTVFISVLQNDFDLQANELQISDADKDYTCHFFDFNDSAVIIVPKVDADTGLYQYFDYYNREVENPVHTSNKAEGYLRVHANPGLPVAVNDSVEAVAGFPVEIYPLLNDLDINGDELIITSVWTSGGICSFNDTVIHFSPYSFLTEDVQFTYRVSEKNNPAHYCDGTIYVEITENTNLPVAVNDTIIVQSYDSLTFNPLLNDFSPYEGNISVSSSAISWGGAFLVGKDPNNSSLVLIISTANFSGTLQYQYKFYYDDNPAMISKPGLLVIQVEPNMDSLLAINDDFVFNPVLPDTFNVLLNDYNPNYDSIEKIGVTQYQDIKCQVINDSLVFFRPDYFLNGDFVFYYYLYKDWPSKPATFAQINLNILNTQLADSLYINNINAGFSCFGLNFWDFDDGKSIRFEVPKGSGKKSIFSNSMWIGGMREDTLYLAAENYRGVGEDYWTGPISAVYQPEDIARYRVWKLNRPEIDYHISHYKDPNYEPIENIRTWPGNGKPDLGQALQLAPFFDQNNDGIYNPYEGDVPMIRGDQSLFFIFNDGRYPHTETLGRNMDVEIHGNAYAFDTPQDSALFNTIFVHYDIYNRSSRTYDSTFFGIRNDFDLGFAWDDYMGCDVSRGSAYVYNDSPIDGNGEPESYGENPPVQSMVILGGVMMLDDGIDNPPGGCDESVNGFNFGDGIQDNERMGMTRFFYFIVGSAGPQIWDPDTAPDFYNFLRGRWKDNSQVIYGGRGHSGDPDAVGPACRFVVPGASDPLNWGTECVYPNGGYNQNGKYWSEETTINNDGDRVGLSITGPITFKPGDVQSLDVAYVYARDNDPEDEFSALDIMNVRIDTIRNRVARNEILPFPNYSVGIAEKEHETFDVIVFPNPANGGEINIDLRKTNDQRTTFQIADMVGRGVLRGELVTGKINAVQIGALKTGIYVLMVSCGDETAVQKLIIHR